MNCRRNSASSGEGEIINLSSMIDVMFILIIFFLVTTTFKEEEIDHMVNLPTDARNQSLTQSTDTLVKINIRKDGTFIIQGKEITPPEIQTFLTAELQKKPELKVLVRCDQEAKHLFLADIMSVCRFVGVPRANIAVKTEQ
ncbi:MAG: biopolymer transporter ExbD [Verrucomicrobiota bacterium]|jgi:biopolymer transport protein ExbD|nr:biopolymer transporter ExbD [Verrucomicrobiota bacterium]